MKLYGRSGWGSAIVEAQLDWYEISYQFEEVDDLFESAAARDALAGINPVAQVPALVLDNGTVLTESAAITLYLADTARRDDLVPGPSDTTRAGFLRWLIFLVANVYPTYTYADDPGRFVSVAAARDRFRGAVDAYAKKLYRDVEAAAGAPWFLGDRFSALDIYLCTMSHWRPGSDWFAANTPKLSTIAQDTANLEPLKAWHARNF